MIVSVFKFFVEKIYYETVSYNRAYNKSTKIELSDIKSRQFVVVFGMVGFVIGIIVFCMARYVVGHSLRNPQVFSVEMAIAVLLAILVVKRLNKLGMYEEAIAKVENKDKRQLIRFRWRSAFIGSVRIIAFLIVIYGTRWLLITYF